MAKKTPKKKRKKPGGRKGRSGPPGNQNAKGHSYGGPRPNSGAPKGNLNNLQSGIGVYKKHGLLPAEVGWIVTEFTQRLDNEIAERFGDDVPFEVECLKETAISNFAVAQLRARWAGQGQLEPEKRDKFLQGFLTALDKRDSKVRAIHERTPDKDPWKTINQEQ